MGVSASYRLRTLASLVSFSLLSVASAGTDNDGKTVQRQINPYTAPGYICYLPTKQGIVVPNTPQQFTYPPDQAILREWMRLGGPMGPMGLPLPQGPQPVPGHKGRHQQFQNGDILIEPDVWPNGVLAAYQVGNTNIQVDWYTDPDASPDQTSGTLNYDKFLLGWSVNGVHHSDWQVELLQSNTHVRTCGNYLMPGCGPGQYAISIEGADFNSLLGIKENVNIGGNQIVDSTVSKQGPMPAVQVNFAQQPYYSQLPGAGPDLSHIHPAQTLFDSRTNFDARAAAAILFEANSYLPQTAYSYESTNGIQLFAKMAYPDYFLDSHLPGRNYLSRQEAIDYLGKLNHTDDWHTGTSNGGLPIVRKGEYETFLWSIIPLLYKYYNAVPEDVRAHIFNNLLQPVSGGYQVQDALPFGMVVPIPETENHQLGIETCRFLTNQLLLVRTNDQKYNNDTNGTTNWLTSKLQKLLTNDFVEYNARPYQDYSLASLLALYSYSNPKTSGGHIVKTLAEMVLDYDMAKAAVSVDDSRRWTTFRRHAVQSGYREPSFLAIQSDVMNAFTMQLAGTSNDINTLRPENVAPGNFAWEFSVAGLSDYRIPDPILDLMINRSHRSFLQRIHHSADELYAGSPSYTLSAGGHYATFAYTAAGVVGQPDDTGKAVATVLLPYGQATSKTELIRFEGVGDDDNVDTHRSNMGVTTDFACGLNPVIPPEYLNVSVSASDSGALGTTHSLAGPWTFINQSQIRPEALTKNVRAPSVTTPTAPLSPIQRIRTGSLANKITEPRTDPKVPLPTNPMLDDQPVTFRPHAYLNPNYTGYYVAIYHKGDLGFMEVYDSAARSPLSFADFVSGVLSKNANSKFSDTGRNSYTMTDGRIVQFEVGPDSQVFDQPTTPFFLSGTVLNSVAGSGIITIDNSFTQRRITLNFQNINNPTITETGVSPGSLVNQKMPLH